MAQAESFKVTINKVSYKASREEVDGQEVWLVKGGDQDLQFSPSYSASELKAALGADKWNQQTAITRGHQEDVRGREEEVDRG